VTYQASLHPKSEFYKVSQEPAQQKLFVHTGCHVRASIFGTINQSGRNFTLTHIKLLE